MRPRRNLWHRSLTMSGLLLAGSLTLAHATRCDEWTMHTLMAEAIRNMGGSPKQALEEILRLNRQLSAPPVVSTAEVQTIIIYVYKHRDLTQGQLLDWAWAECKKPAPATQER